MQTRDMVERFPASKWSRMAVWLYGIFFRLLLWAFPAQELAAMIEAVEGRREG